VKRGDRLAIVALLTTSALFEARTARGDVSSWAFVGAGPTWVENEELERTLQASLLMEAGLGTPPSHAVIAGGLFRVQTHFGLGTDLALSVRTATRGFVRGGFGLALDLGPYFRFWGDDSFGGQASLVLGAPWGITLSGGGGLGSHDSRHFGVVLGLDFARLTVYRDTGTNWYPNPFPAR
jgi:hypothetical protein